MPWPNFGLLILSVSGATNEMELVKMGSNFYEVPFVGRIAGHRVPKLWLHHPGGSRTSKVDELESPSYKCGRVCTEIPSKIYLKEFKISCDICRGAN